MTSIAAMKTLISLECKMAFRHRAQLLNPLLFFTLIALLFGIALGAEPKILTIVGPGIIWVAALLASLLSVDRLFKPDFEDGSLEQLLLSARQSSLLVFAKIIAHWILTALPLIVIVPVIALSYQLSTPVIYALILSLLLGTPVLSALTAIGVALTVGLPKGGLLLAIIVLPLYLPVLIFGTLAAKSAMLGIDYSGHLALLGAMMIMGLLLAPIVTTQALKTAVQL